MGRGDAATGASPIDASSIVRIGPLNVFLAQPKYQIVTTAIVPKVTNGA